MKIICSLEKYFWSGSSLARELLKEVLYHVSICRLSWDTKNIDTNLCCRFNFLRNEMTPYIVSIGRAIYKPVEIYLYFWLIDVSVRKKGLYYKVNMLNL